jgi:hypothetical protein
MDVEIKPYSCSTPSLDGGECKYKIQPLYTRERLPSTHFREGWVGSRVGLDGYEANESLSPTGVRNLVRPDRTESLH